MKVSLRGTLYVLGGTCAYASVNVMLPTNLRAWWAFGLGAVANMCVIWRAFIDGSHARVKVDKVITDLEPPEVEHSEATVSTTVATTTSKSP